MTLSTNRLIDELSIFSDIGAEAPRYTEDGYRIAAYLTRGGSDIKIIFDKKTGKVSECVDGKVIVRANYRSLLASETFANLRSWAGSQQQLLRAIISEDNLLPFIGTFSAGRGAGDQEVDLPFVNNFLTEARPENGVNTLLVDGPAGIGKTRFIEILSFQRAKEFTKRGAPLILHVKSRGRVLTFLQDLMAFSLQTMRLQVTYDQIPILVRHGLVQLAIDGFDELGDPNGYENAWAQVRDLVSEITGSGAIILAGRETFIGRDRLLKAVPFLDGQRHCVAVFTLRTPYPNVGRQWLSRQGWSDEQLKTAEEWDLFADGSYALRPFFLAQLAVLGREQPDFLQSLPPLILLVERMIEREASKFPDGANNALKPRSASTFVFDVLAEVARDIAESQSDSLDEDNLLWIVDAVLGDGFDQEMSRILKNRVNAIAFLQPDTERRGRRSFSHTEFFNYFLAYAAISALTRNEIPKFIRRMIFGTDFLVIFTMVAEALGDTRAATFLDATVKLLSEASQLDRGARNIGSLLIASMSIPAFLGRTIANADVDDAVIRDTVVSSTLSHVTINQLDIRGADLSSATFRDTIVATAIADDTSRVCASFPDVSYLQLQSLAGEKTLVGDAAIAWLDTHGRRPACVADDHGIPEELAQHGLIRLMMRLCRVMLRQHWIKSDCDDFPTALIEHDMWSQLKPILEAHGLLEERENLGTRGRPATVFHIRRALEILSEQVSDDVISNFINAVVRKARTIPG